MEIGPREFVGSALECNGSIYVETFTRRINGKEFDFTVSTESRGNGVTVTRIAVWANADALEPLHAFD